MILRFMGMNFSAITDGTAHIPSSVGDDVKPAFTESSPASVVPTVPGAKTPEQDKAMWEGTISFSNLQSPSHGTRSLLQCRVSRIGPGINSRRSWHSPLVSHPPTTLTWFAHHKE